MDTRKAYGVVTALGTYLGEKARDDAATLDALRSVEGAPALRDHLTAAFAGSKLQALAATFCDEVITDTDWKVWRSRLLLQAKMVKEGGKPAPGHERKGL